MKTVDRKQLYADKMFFSEDSVIPVNALGLIEELLKQEALERELKETKRLLEYYKEKSARLEAQSITMGRIYDVRG